MIWLEMYLAVGTLIVTAAFIFCLWGSRSEFKRWPTMMSLFMVGVLSWPAAISLLLCFALLEEE